MKATGIVRRIDDLGRVVIPKEIRRTMRIREGDPLEIFTATDGEVIFKKYSPIGELSAFAEQYAEVLYRATDLPVLIADRDHIIATFGMPKKDVLDQRISENLEALMDARKSYIATPDLPPIYPVQNLEREAAVVFPILGAGDLSGCVILMLSSDGEMPSETEIKLTEVAASFLGRQTEP